ncbi:MAG TPA: hypothetical protein VGM58_07510 [Verrucomicrobiae bacterium]
MKAATKILLVVVGLLFLIDIGWRVWVWHHYAAGREVLKNFKVEYLHTNDWSGIGIFDAKSDQPIWTKFDIGHDSNSIMESYYFRGKDTFDVTVTSNRPPKYGVFFRGSGKSVTWWLDDVGSGLFTDRISYNTNGNFYKREIWYKEAWHLVDRRNETNGIVINGKWFQLGRDTNGWTIETQANQ